MSIGVTSPASSKLRPPSELVRWAGPDLTDMASLFGAACREYQARPAYRVDGTWITYADCGARVSRIAASLRDRLVQYRQATGKQPTIAVLLPNSHHVLEFFFTAAVTHSILFPLNHRLSAAEIEAGLRASGAMILLTSDAFAETLAEIHWDTLSVQTIIWTNAPVDLPVKEHRSWDSLLSEAAPPAREPSLPAPSSYLQGFGTSGTTGRTKTVLHSHHNVYVHSFATIQALELSADDDHCWGHFGPMFHVGDAAFVWIALLLGARHIFHENQLHFEEVGKLLADEHVTIVKLVPSMLQLMCESDSIKALKFPDLRWILTGGAAPDPALVHRVATLFDCDFIQGFGMTEATCHVAFKVETQAPMKEGLRVLPGLDLKVVDPDDETVGPGQVGEIVLKGETVFSGYLADGKVETGNTEVFTRDGYYRSGDLGLPRRGRPRPRRRPAQGHDQCRRGECLCLGGRAGHRPHGRREGVRGLCHAGRRARRGRRGCHRSYRRPADGGQGEGALSEAAGEFQGPAPRAFPGRAAADADRQGAEAAHRGANPGHAGLRRGPAHPGRAVVSVARDRTNGRGGRDHVHGHADQRAHRSRSTAVRRWPRLPRHPGVDRQLEQRFSLKVPPTLLYDHPTIRELAAYFASQDAPRVRGRPA